MKCKLYDTSHLGGYPYPTEKSNRLIADHIPFLKFHFFKILITSFLVRYTYLFHIGRFCSNKESRHRTPTGPFFMLKKNRALSAPLCTQYKKQSKIFIVMFGFVFVSISFRTYQVPVLIITIYATKLSRFTILLKIIFYVGITRPNSLI